VAQHRLVFESFGLVAEVVSEDRQLFDSLPEVLPPDWRPADRETMARFELTKDGVITVDGEVVARAGAEDGTSLVRFGSIVRHRLAEHAPAHVFIHAGVVCGGGTAILIPGSSHSGKTTLVAELVRAGATYYSDEYAPVDSAGMIHPYAKPLSIRSDGDGAGVLVAVPEVHTGRTPIQAGLIVLTSYEPGAEWRPGTCTAGEGALGLLEHTIPARSRPSDALEVVCKLAQGARVISGKRGEASGVADALLGMTA
jgi:hypothetical protein